ncbi:MAG: hypothetical protein QXD03_00535 [Candidatus Anstonellales archaeon]
MKVDIISREEIKEGEAYRIKSDVVLDLIVRYKKLMGTYQGNELYVAKKSIEEYKKRRKDFENAIVLGVIIGIAFTVLLVISALNNPAQAISSLIGGVILGLLFLVLVILTKYIPAIEETPVMIGGENGKENNNKG